MEVPTEANKTTGENSTKEFSRACSKIRDVLSSFNNSFSNNRGKGQLVAHRHLGHKEDLEQELEVLSPMVIPTTEI